MKRVQRPHGFTLIEVLIALALVATTLGGTIAVISNALGNQEYLQRRVGAGWVADNIVNAYVLEPASFGERERQGSETLLGRVFAFEIGVTPIEEDDDAGIPEGTQRVVVSVADAASGATPLAQRVFHLVVPEQSL